MKVKELKDLTKAELVKMAKALDDNLAQSNKDVDLFRGDADTLRASNSNLIGCIKVAREMLNLGLREAKELIDPAYLDPPQSVVLASGLNREHAAAWDQAFKSGTAASAKYAIVQE